MRLANYLLYNLLFIVRQNSNILSPACKPKSVDNHIIIVDYRGKQSCITH